MKANFLSGYAYGFAQPVCIVSISDTVVYKVYSELLNNLSSYENAPQLKNNQNASISDIMNVVEWLYEVANVPVIKPFLALNTSQFVFAYCDQQLADMTLKTVYQCFSSSNFTSKKFKEAIDALTKIAKQKTFSGINNPRILRLASEFGVPVNQLGKHTFRVGEGKERQFFSSTVTSETDATFLSICMNKILLKNFVSQLGLPTAKYKLINNISDLKQASESLGFPVVIKPIDKDQGLGVYNGLKNEKHVHWAYEQAKKVSNKILIEQHIDGKDYRINLYNGSIIEIYQRVPGGVVGDGKHIIKELLVIAQNDEQHARRSQSRGRKLLVLDNEANSLLEELSLTEQSIPQKGQFVPLRRKANLSSGGKNHMLATQDIHPDNLSLINYIASVIPLNFMGIDIIMTDIKESWQNTSCGILEINGQPQLSEASVRLAFTPMMERLKQALPHKTLIICDDKALITQLNNFLLSYKFRTNLGVASPCGVFINQQKLREHDTYFTDSQAIHSSTLSQSVYLMYSTAEILKNGLSSSYFDQILHLSEKDNQHNALVRNFVTKHCDKFSRLDPSFSNIEHYLINFSENKEL